MAGVLCSLASRESKVPPGPNLSSSEYNETNQCTFLNIKICITVWFRRIQIWWSGWIKCFWSITLQEDSECELHVQGHSLRIIPLAVPPVKRNGRLIKKKTTIKICVYTFYKEQLVARCLWTDVHTPASQHLTFGEQMCLTRGRKMLNQLREPVRPRNTPLENPRWYGQRYHRDTEKAGSTNWPMWH